jgi:hypothetical protein
MKKATKKHFCKIYPKIAKLRKTDSIQFNVLFNEWKRKFI